VTTDEGPRPRVAIIGSGDVARTLAHRFVAAGYQVSVAGWDQDAVEQLAAASGAQVMSVEGAAAWSDVVILAIPFHRHRDLPAEAFRGKVVVDATDYFPQEDGPIADLDAGRMTSSELLARHLAGARIVKAFNTANLLALGAVGPLADDVEPPAIPVAGDDPAAKEVVQGLIVDLGFVPMNVGCLADSWRLQPGMPVHGLPPESGASVVRRALVTAP
jgi:8-hydroxy-5-deazaflavin:NADPH oxidoreductase